jgi:prevent-host-death family protein
MTTIGSLEAQNTLPQLLQRVAQGEEIVITEEGKPVAKLVPSRVVEPPEMSQTPEDLTADRPQPEFVWSKTLYRAKKAAEEFSKETHADY